MYLETISGLVLFALVSSITPGPNNIMLLASGLNFGFIRSIPHMLGITLGFSFMIFCIGLALSQLFVRYPASYVVLRYACTFFFVYLALRLIQTSPDTHSEKSGGKPLTFFQAVLFQWVNPKAWAMGISAISLYASTNTLPSISAVAGIFALCNFLCICCWTLLGANIARWLQSSKSVRAFNVIMAILLIASLYPIWAMPSS